MSFRVKDFWKNVIAEFESESELNEFVSASQFTSSVAANDDSASLNYFQYDTDIHELLYVSGGLVSGSGEDLIRITYTPGQEDTEE